MRNFLRRFRMDEIGTSMVSIRFCSRLSFGLLSQH
jgi:hypothetical protein